MNVRLVLKLFQLSVGFRSIPTACKQTLCLVSNYNISKLGHGVEVSAHYSITNHVLVVKVQCP